MPRIHRRAPQRRDWTDLHRAHLRGGPHASYQRFGEPMGVSCRKREGEYDFAPATMATAKAAWQDLAGELLADVADPNTLWAFRRFGPCQE